MGRFRSRVLRLIRGSGRADERGALTPAVAVMALGFMVLGGMVVDGGRQMTAKLHAQQIANEAARAGAIYIDQRQEGAHLDQDKATAAVDAYCDEVMKEDSGTSFDVTECGVGDPWMTIEKKQGRDFEYLNVDVQVRQENSLLGIVGINAFVNTVHASAAPVQAVLDPFNDPLQPSYSVSISYPPTTFELPTTSIVGTTQQPVPSEYETTLCGTTTTIPLTVGLTCSITTSTHVPPPPPATTQTLTTFSTYPTSVPPSYPRPGQ